MIELRDYQQQAVDMAVSGVLRSLESGERFRVLFAAPTGTGKSYPEIIIKEELQSRGVNVGLVSPRMEILTGFLDKMGITPEEGPVRLRRQLEEHGLFTPVRLANLFCKGELPPFQCLIFDEAHHSVAETYKIIDAIHGGNCPSIGFTATAFRGSPRETEKLHRYWGEPVVLIKWREAVERGYCSMPEIELVPLVDDDKIQVRGGDFQIGGAKGVEKAIVKARKALVELCVGIWRTDERPTVLALPTTQLVSELSAALRHADVPTAPVIQSTPLKERQQAFQRALAHEAMIVQIGVLGEGVDYPFRILIDAKPTMSPVAFQQLVGRITRPSDDTPLYIVTNRNLDRHGYLFEGLLPRKVVLEGQEAWGTSTRGVARRIDLELLQRHKPIPVPLLDGLKATAYNLYNWDPVDGRRVEWFVLVHPITGGIISGSRVNYACPDGTMQWGRYRYTELPMNFTGFETSKARGSMSPKQQSWWERDAYRLGLDPHTKVSGRTFQVLPFLQQLGVRRVA